MDMFVDMVMRHPPAEQTAEDIAGHYEVNASASTSCSGPPRSMGIKAGIYVSTRTVHSLPTTAEGRPTYYGAEETMALSTTRSVYGLTKGLGERISQ